MKQPELPDSGDNMDIANHRLQVAKEDLKDANILLESNSYRGANNRAYYAIFHAVSAVLATEGVAFKKHKGTQAYFNKNYVATEVFPRELLERMGKETDDVYDMGMYQQKC